MKLLTAFVGALICIGAACLVGTIVWLLSLLGSIVMAIIVAVCAITALLYVGLEGDSE